MCELLQHERECNTFTIIDIIGTIVSPRKRVKGRANDCMQTHHYQITICQLRKNLVKWHSEHEYWIYPVFCIPSPRPLSYAERQLCKPRCEAVVSGVTGAIEALGHQQVVCFYSHIWVSEPWPKLKQSYTKILGLKKTSSIKVWRMHKIKMWQMWNVSLFETHIYM